MVAVRFRTMHTRREGKAVLMPSLSRLEVGRRLCLRRLLANHVNEPHPNLTIGNYLTMNQISIPGAEHSVHQLSHGGELDASQEVTLLQPS
jgi:hypothetical protein